MTFFTQHRWVAPLFVAVLAALVFPAAVLAQAPSPLSPASPSASSIANLHNVIMLIALVIFIIVEGLLLYSVVRFRRRDDEEMPRQIYGSVPVEIAWTVAPAIIVIILMILTFRTMRTVAETPSSNTVNVQVVAHQWWWEFRYPDLGIVTANELHVPVGEVARFDLESADVIHSFWVPQLAGKTDAMPGRTTQTWFQADEPGVYQGQCAEFCGAQHGQMRFDVVVESQEDFDAWVEQQTAGPVEVTGDLAQRGEELFFQPQNQCTACHTIQGTAAQGKVGPDLTHLGGRRTIAAGTLENTPENLAEWIRNPQQVKPRNKMPNLDLAPETVDALVAYLQSLK